MPGARVHAQVGVLVGAASAAVFATAVESTQASTEMLGGAIGGWMGGLLPDVSEPATSPQHRGTMHSALAAMGLTLIQFTAWQARCRDAARVAEQNGLAWPVDSDERSTAAWEAFAWHFASGMIVGFLAGYASHLALDAATPRGLPLVG